jgi:hypothetical protein
MLCPQQHSLPGCVADLNGTIAPGLAVWIPLPKHCAAQRTVGVQAVGHSSIHSPAGCRVHAIDLTCSCLIRFWSWEVPRSYHVLRHVSMMRFANMYLYSGSRVRVRFASSPAAIMPNSSSTSGFPTAAAASWWPSIQRSEKVVSARQEATLLP